MKADKIKLLKSQAKGKKKVNLTVSDDKSLLRNKLNAT